jgi:hypothetical protein
MPRKSVLRFIVKEFKELAPPTIFFAVGFNLILLTINLILGQYQVKYASVVAATIGALVIGKAALLANALPFFRKMDNQPLIRPVLFKSGIYWVVVCLVRFIEKLVEFLVHGGKLRDLSNYMATHFTWNQFFAIQIWVLVLFLIYTFLHELNTLFGHGELYRILFTWRSSELKQTRRHRIRILTQLSRLADAHSTRELADPTTVAHRHMIGLIRSLAKVETSLPITPGQ